MPYIQAFIEIDNSTTFDELINAIDSIEKRYSSYGIPPEMAYRVCILYSMQFGTSYEDKLRIHYYVTKHEILDNWYYHLFISGNIIQTNSIQGDPLYTFIDKMYYSGMTFHELHFVFCIFHYRITLSDMKKNVNTTIVDKEDYELISLILDNDSPYSWTQMYAMDVKNTIRTHWYWIPDTTMKYIKIASIYLKNMIYGSVP